MINPILGGLRYVSYYFGREVWTWRYRTGGFEAASPTAGMVSINYHPNLEDLRKNEPRVRKVMDGYDRSLDSAAGAFSETHRALVSDRGFLRAVDEADEEYARADVKPREWWGALPRRERAHLVGERVVNGAGELDDSYDARFWSQQRQRLMAFRKAAEHSGRFGALAEVGRRAKQAAERLAADLTRLRQDLAETYDIPPVPVDEETGFWVAEGDQA